jgi:hypothetical protein
MELVELQRLLQDAEVDCVIEACRLVTLVRDVSKVLEDSPRSVHGQRHLGSGGHHPGGREGGLQLWLWPLGLGIASSTPSSSSSSPSALQWHFVLLLFYFVVIYFRDSVPYMSLPYLAHHHYSLMPQ